MWTCDPSFRNSEKLSRCRQVDSNPEPHACAPCSGMISCPNIRRLTTMWYKSSVISILAPSPSTGHISALTCQPLEILGVLQSSHWVIFSYWIHYHSLVLVQSRVQVFLPSLHSSHSYNIQLLGVIIFVLLMQYWGSLYNGWLQLYALIVPVWLSFLEHQLACQWAITMILWYQEP